MTIVFGCSKCGKKLEVASKRPEQINESLSRLLLKPCDCQFESGYKQGMEDSCSNKK